MKYLKKFEEHSEYEAFTGTTDFVLPNVSYCETQNEVHYIPFIPEPKALKFSANGAQTLSLSNKGGNAPVLEYSLDRGVTWTSWDYSAIEFGNGTDLYIRGDNPEGFSSGQEEYSNFVFGDDSVEVECSGNIMHLLSYEEDLLTIPCDYCYNYIFSGCTSLTTAPELPATTLTERCYQYMFKSCTNLTTAPELPATTLANYCYGYMFYVCRSLTTAPELPATTLAEGCYDCMFQSCTSLTTAPELPATTLAGWCYTYMFRSCTSLSTAPELPATTMATGCYYYMFLGCTSLTTAPELPAMTLASSCYMGMFKSCTNLTSAPVLPATTLTERCYYEMFKGCTNLNNIKCLATDISANYCLSIWLSGVSSTGTFVKKAGVTYPSGADGIPSGWTVEEV